MKLLLSSIVITMSLAATTSYADSINEHQVQQKRKALTARPLESLAKSIVKWNKKR